MEHSHHPSLPQRPNLRKVNHISLKPGMSVNALVQTMADSGVMGAGKIGQAVNIAEAMIKDPQCKVFLGVAGAMIPGGMRQILIDMVEEGMVDVVVTTGATLTHDLVETLGYHHYQGAAHVDDAELHKQHYDRMYDSYMPNEVYEGMEDFFSKNWEHLAQQPMNIREFLWKIGELLQCSTEKPYPNSLLGACFRKKVPLFCPAIADSGIGLMIWGRLAQGKKIQVAVFDDLKEMMDLAWESERAGVFYMGGGVPKNYIQQAMQMAPKSAEYGIQITMDRPEPGGSSGAPLKEGISWGKMNYEAKHVDVICDATIALPLIVGALKERLTSGKK